MVFRANISEMILATRPGKNRLSVLSFWIPNFFFFFLKRTLLLIAFHAATCSTLRTRWTPLPPSFTHLLICCKARVSKCPVLGEEVDEMNPKCFLLVLAMHHVLTVLLYIVSAFTQLNTQAFSNHFSQARRLLRTLAFDVDHLCHWVTLDLILLRESGSLRASTFLCVHIPKNQPLGALLKIYFSVWNNSNATSAELKKKKHKTVVM